MRLDIPTPRTLEEWARSRCREILRSAAPSLTRCDEPIAFACDACGATVCSRHARIGLADRIQRNHGGSLRLQVVERGPDLCPACWERDQAAAVAKIPCRAAATSTGAVPHPHPRLAGTPQPTETTPRIAVDATPRASRRYLR